MSNAIHCALPEGCICVGADKAIHCNAYKKYPLHAYPPSAIHGSSKFQDPVIPERPETVLEEAQRLVYGDRMDDYGDARAEAEKIAAGWSVIFGFDVRPEHCALAMCWLKIVRQTNKAKRDNLVDLAGYAGLVEKVERGR